MKTEFSISPVLKGLMTANDALQSQGTISFSTIKSELLKGGIFFQLIDNDFIFIFSIQNQNLVVQRNEIVSILTLEKAPDNTRLVIFMMWSFSELHLICKYGPNINDELSSKVPTTPCAPPISLVKWARMQNLLPIKTYSNEEEFRTKVHSCLQSIQDKIYEAGGYSQFWNIIYDGQKIKSREPKREKEIHPTIHCLLSDQALLSSFEVIPEYQTGIGNLDFLLNGIIKGGEISKICIEFKNAHSPDLYHGVTNQLPDYMRNCKAKYGVYCVLNYKGEWFDKPVFDDKIDLSIILHNVRYSVLDPIQENIRLMMYSLSKPKSASKK